jgi:phage N-6-adenine-methyltransferase
MHVMQFHEVANIFPMMSAEEFESLKQSITKNGQRVPIYTFEGRIVDGRNRYRACLDLGVSPWFEEWNGEGLLCDFVWDLNAERRDLDKGAKQMSAARYAIELEKESKTRQMTGLRNVGSSLPIGNNEDFGRSVEKAADKFNMGFQTVARAVAVEKQGAPELVRAVESGAASVSAAAEVASLPVEEQREIVSQGAKAIVEAAKAIREGKSPHVAHNSGNNEWYTPAEYIEAARQVLGAIDLDPASSDIANQAVQAKHYFTAEVDGLAHEWSGRVWMNPPYAGELIGQFTSKLMQHYDEGKIEAAIVLVNNATETKWFQEMAQEASAVCFPRGRVRFLDPNGQPGAPLQGQALLYIGDNVEGFKDAFSQFGVVFS